MKLKWLRNLFQRKSRTVEEILAKDFSERYESYRGGYHSETLLSLPTRGPMNGREYHGFPAFIDPVQPTAPSEYGIFRPLQEQLQLHSNPIVDKTGCIPFPYPGVGVRGYTGLVGHFGVSGAQIVDIKPFGDEPPVTGYS